MWSETGTVRKDPGGRLNIALVYPSTYWVGMSNLGLQQMYRLLNDHPGIVCERFFSDSPRSVEADRPLQDFHVIAFSISYEMDFIEAVRILRENGITVSARQRLGRPIVMAGGAALTMNPEPLADACDICFMGDGETLPPRLHEAFSKSASYDEFLETMSLVDGVYLPGETRPVYEGDSIVSFEGTTPRLSREDPLTDPARTSVMTRDTAFGDMYLVEIARGCPFSCAFCSAREIYSPYRSVSIDRFRTILDEASGQREKIGLVSTSLNNHPEAAAIFAEVRSRGMKVAPPSLRSGMISPELLAALSESGVMGVALAPETGSERLRTSAGKHIRNDTILEDVRALVAAGIRDIKLYFMVGLPGERPADIDETIDLIRRIRQTFIKVSRGNRKIGKVAVSVNTFVPKPHTPFERQPMVEPDDARSRIRRIEKGLKAESNIQVSFEGPKWAYLQALVSRGDRRLLTLLCELAGHDSSSWHSILKHWPLNPDYYALRARDASELLPWSFLRRPCSGGGRAGGTA